MARTVPRLTTEPIAAPVTLVDATAAVEVAIERC